MKTADQIKQDIRQVRREIAGIEDSLPTIVSRDGLEALYAAQDSLKIRQSSLQALTDYLPVAEEQERAQAEQDKRQENENLQEQARAGFDDANAKFQHWLLGMAAYVLKEMPEGEHLTRECAEFSRQHTDAWLANHPEQRRDLFGLPELGNGRFGFGVVLEDADQPTQQVQEALRQLYNARRNSGHYIPTPIYRTQELQQPDTTDAFRAQVVSEFVSKG